MMAEWDDGRCYIVGSMQCPYYVHKAMKPLLGCDADGVVISQSVTGGGFGGKEEYPSMLAAHVALLAKKAQQRGEDRLRPRRGHRRDDEAPPGAHAAAGSRSTRRARSLAIDVDCRDGRRRVPDAVAGRAVARRAARGRAVPLPGRARARPRRRDEPSAARRVPRLRRAADDVRVRAPDAEARASRAARIRSRCASGSRCARATRRRPARSSGSPSAPTRCSPRSSRSPGAPPERERRAQRRAGAARPRLRASTSTAPGFTGSGEQRLAGTATVARTVDGRFEVRSSSTDIGQGAITMFTQIAAAALGVDRVAASTSSIRRPRRCPTSGPTVASRTCMVVGGARRSREAARKLDA